MKRARKTAEKGRERVGRGAFKFGPGESVEASPEEEDVSGRSIWGGALPMKVLRRQRICHFRGAAGRPVDLGEQKRAAGDSSKKLIWVCRL